MRALLCLCVWLALLLNWNLSNGYRNSRLQDYLCANKFFLKLQQPFTGDPSVTLMDDRESAAIITQTWNVTLPGTNSNHNVKLDCKFRILTPKHKPRGIYTIITQLKFRQNRHTGECLDYIQFFAGNRSPSERICNDISIDGPAGRFIFDERDRNVNVHVHIDDRMISEPLEMRMVMTAHSECRYTGDFLCDPTNSFSCISRHFVRDNVTNCMYPCRDEVSCFHDAMTTVDVDPANVALSAITSLIFTMVGVGFCVWICWKYWNCITVQQHAHEASAAAHQRSARVSAAEEEAPTVRMPTAPEFDDVAVSGAGTQQLSSPQLQQPQTPKDLPPSYESLFPDR